MHRRDGTASKSFRGVSGEAEHYICVTAPPGLGLAEEIDAVERRYAEARSALNLPPESAIFRRIFVSDVMNQAAALRRSRLAAAPEDGPVAVSLVRQPPSPGTKLALLAYHIESAAPLTKTRSAPNHIRIEKGGLRHFWSTGLCAGADAEGSSSAAQTHTVFDELITALAREGGSLREHCVRTWIYLKDVDVFYQGMVDSRTALFQAQGLTSDTHYIASTGIEGACAHRYDLVAMDAYSILGLAPQQVSYLNDFDRLCATKDYNVTFERGTRVAYADRAHHFISGTASIDKAGRVLHPGSVLSQLDRALENVDALLRSGGAALDDMMHLTVYLRDPADFAWVDTYLAERLPGLPALIVEGAVCRPDWLIEVEGVAVRNHVAPELPHF